MSVDYRGECDGTPCAATRSILPAANAYCYQSPLMVRIALAPPNGATIVALEDGPPAGWVAVEISDGGVFDMVNWKVKWGPFFVPNVPPAVSYKVIPVNDQAVAVCFSGTISIDGISEPICGRACVNVACAPFMAADLPQPPCPPCLIGDCNSCPTGTCRDGRITLCEVIGYACAWKRGCNDDLNGMARAAFVWRNGECYCWDDGAGNWFPTGCPPPESGYCPADGGSPAPGTDAESAAGGKVTIQVPRERHTDRGAARTLQAQVRFTPPAGASVMAFELDIPQGWTVSNLANDGQWDDSHRKAKWGPFFDDVSPVITFELVADRDGRSIGRPKAMSRAELVSVLNGRVSFDGVAYPISAR